MSDSVKKNAVTTASGVIRIVNCDPAVEDIQSIYDCFIQSGFPDNHSYVFVNCPKSETVSYTAFLDDGTVLSQKCYATYIVTMYCDCDVDLTNAIGSSWMKFMSLLAEEFKNSKIGTLAFDVHMVKTMPDGD